MGLVVLVGGLFGVDGCRLAYRLCGVGFVDRCTSLTLWISARSLAV